MHSRINSPQSNSRFKSTIGLAALAVVLTGAAPRTALSATEGPFSALHGSWAGGGLIKKANGTNERIRCRSTYDTGATSVQLRLRCASDSYNFDLNATVFYDGGPISGQWSETTRSVNGNIQGRSSNNGRLVQAVASGLGFSANLTMTTRGEKQSVTILAPGTEVPEVNITLEKH
jgi:hypothetical protein